MNPSAEAVAPPPPPLQPSQLPQAHRLSTSCDRHPEEHFTGFCPSCLCERLAVLEPSTNSSSSSTSRKPPTSSNAAAALRAIFKPPIGGGGASSSNKNRPTSFFPELRRTKSFSASKNEGFSGVFEPQRKSCDVRVRNTLWTLFHQDDGRNPNKKEAPPTDAEVETRNLGGSSSSFRGPVFESKEEDEDEEDENQCSDGEDFGIEICEETIVANVTEDKVPEIVEEEEEEFQPPQPVTEQFEEEDLKPMKDHIDLDSQTKKRDLKEIAGSFWSAASVFSKKLQKWRQKQKLKKRRNGCGSATLPVEKPIGRQFRETQSEIADYGFGRRSCDTDPRFSLDAGRMSFDDPRYSFDEPRASWDGYLIGRTFPRMPTMLSVVEDAPVVHVARCDAQIPVEEPPMNSIEEETVPGGSAQTRDYYLDSSSRRRKSLDRSNSIRKTAEAVVADIDEMKSVSNANGNAKVSPTTVPDNRDLREFYNSNSLRDDCSETFETGSFRGGGDSASVVGNGERNKGCKKSRRWSKAWNIWSFIHRRGGNKDEDDDRYSSVRANGVERSFSESWPELRGGGGGERNGEAKGFNPKLMRSNSSASWRNGSHGYGGFGGGAFGSMRKSNGSVPVVEANGFGNGNGGRKKKDDQVVLERNRSARYSPNHIDNGLLRFYLTPMRSSWRSGGVGKSRSSHAHSIARSVLRLY
ncbi:protein OCTOPUS-like [Pyrus x bretschneideri]|uniref:protein OCTOPUS-like n=1 Tax=Pyrus x bretschneideri TaxID=225117 RepID=UPI00202FE6D4|nr:protein OCTOPUS-like [Pyrus x bretschneideri]